MAIFVILNLYIQVSLGLRNIDVKIDLEIQKVNEHILYMKIN